MRKRLFTREIYKKIKKYDRTQMENFLEEIYQNGYLDGKESVPGIDLIKIQEAIEQTKGIGKVKSGEIMKNIDDLFAAQK